MHNVSKEFELGVFLGVTYFGTISISYSKSGFLSCADHYGVGGDPYLDPLPPPPPSPLSLPMILFLIKLTW